MAVDPEGTWNLELDETILQDLYAWIDQIPLSRPKRRIERDFSDGVMVAELVKYYFPNWVELHNYAQANNTQQKMINWGLLNRKVFSRFGLNVPEHVIRGISLGKNGLVETFLYNLRIKIDDYLYGMENNTSDPEYRNLFRANKQMNPSPRVGARQNEDLNYQVPPKLPTVTKAKQAITGDSVPRLLYEEKEQECIAKDEQLQILNAKIRRLEHLLHLKDVRLQDLTEKLEKNVKIKK
ncbi:unnamed protein product [Brachionus calyciflorus]|uniref:Calponin-homology (CH) domain-containing protein n=1 Tax=Brachionus calyciflorus TaxID=104777 RepID=A0A813MMZ3_9BILA|nr:unnamed protein product [Brachionus calyciflorus]